MGISAPPVSYRSRRSNAALVMVCIMALLAAGCATIAGNDFQRARTLGPGHMEAGVSLSTGRTPGTNPALKPNEGSSDGEEWSAVPVPTAHFRTGLAENLDGGVRVAPTGLDFSIKQGLTDRDEFMSALVWGLGYSTTAPVKSAMDLNRSSHAAHASFAVPLARRLSWFSEGHIRPNVAWMQVYSEQDDPMGRIGRWYWTGHAGVAVGASFAAWRVRISPEINVVAAYRSDHDQLFITAYPGIGAFIVY